MVYDERESLGSDMTRATYCNMTMNNTDYDLSKRCLRER